MKTVTVVRVPPQDRGPCDLSRVPGVISKASSEFYKIRTEYGLLSRQFQSGELEKYDTVAAKSDKFRRFKCDNIKRGSKKIQQQRK